MLSGSHRDVLELSSLSGLGAEFSLDFSTIESSIGSLLKFHRENSNLSLEEISKRTKIEIDELKAFETGKKNPSFSELKKIAESQTINLRDLLSNDKIEEKVNTPEINEQPEVILTEPTPTIEDDTLTRSPSSEPIQLENNSNRQLTIDGDSF